MQRRSDPADNHSHRHAHPADAGLSALDFRVLRNAIQLCHFILLTNPRYDRGYHLRREF